MADLTNEQRAEWAYRAVQKHSQTTGSEEEEMDTQMSDLLCNMMHMADEQGLDFSEVMEQASRHYDTEVNSEA